MNYERGELIGQGGMAEVYRGCYIGLNPQVPRWVALKFLKTQFCGDEEIVRRFLREAQICYDLRHPNVVRVHEMGREHGQPYMVMDLLECQTLRARLQHGPLPEAAALAVTRQVLAALEAAHRCGIVHYDIKPGNILLTQEAPLAPGSVKVTDFGIARRSVASGPGLNPGEPDDALGTPAYMSPEQVRGDPTIDCRSDLYAVGILLYEMLTGAPPFTGPAAAVARRQLEETPPALPATVAPAVQQVVTTALQKLPAKRFDSARAMLALLPNHTNNVPALPPQASLSTPQSPLPIPPLEEPPTILLPPDANFASPALKPAVNAATTAPPTARAMPPVPNLAPPATPLLPALPTAPMALPTAFAPPAPKAPPVPNVEPAPAPVKIKAAWVALVIGAVLCLGVLIFVLSQRSRPPAPAKPAAKPAATRKPVVSTPAAHPVVRHAAPPRPAVVMRRRARPVARPRKKPRGAQPARAPATPALPF